MKRAISITIGEDNLLWLKGQAGASANGSVSEVIDRLVREARTAGRTDAAAIRSVVGSIDSGPTTRISRERTPTCGSCSIGRWRGRCRCGSVPPRARANGVAEVDAAVTDTHALLYHAAATPGSGAECRRAFRARRGAPRDRLRPRRRHVGGRAARARRRATSLRRPPRDFFADLFSNPAYQPYDLTPAQIFDADDLRINRDPFDALIFAAARDLGLPLLTRDTDIGASGACR